ncbi:hypothetical protein J6590_067245 [Homalodisca vitripennis]|nr:hypothetical protein J6590_067245 [Homalodisca vitripennis]
MTTFIARNDVYDMMTNDRLDTDRRQSPESWIRTGKYTYELYVRLRIQRDWSKRQPITPQNMHTEHHVSNPLASVKDWKTNLLLVEKLHNFNSVDRFVPVGSAKRQMPLSPHFVLDLKERKASFLDLLSWALTCPKIKHYQTKREEYEVSTADKIRYTAGDPALERIKDGMDSVIK